MTLQFEYEQLEATLHLGGTAADRSAIILAEARTQAEALRREAQRAGYEAGLAEGRTVADQELLPARSALEHAARELTAQLDGRVELLERQAAELAVQLADRVVAAALEVRPELVLDAIRGVLRAVLERDRLVLEVNPEDLALVQAGAAEIAAKLGGVRELEVVAEPRVSRGGCVVRTAEGEVDGSVASQLDRAREVVLAALGGDA
jgi:flagellar biosynthesis/type III secretory pathway protein FliH